MGKVKNLVGKVKNLVGKVNRISGQGQETEWAKWARFKAFRVLGIELQGSESSSQGLESRLRV